MKKLTAAFFTALIMTAAVTSYSDAVHGDLENNLIRLHIIADSDDAAAQSVKLKVRDAVINGVGEKLKSADIDEGREKITKSLDEIERIADETLRENGCTYTSRAEYGEFYFPRREYDGITLPEGEYYGVRVVLGSGGGKNWWCVMYPPMCFAEGSGGKLSEESDKRLKSELNIGSYDIITGTGRDVEVRFGVVELVQKAKRLITGN